jgi:hypothetical protein
MDVGTTSSSTNWGSAFGRFTYMAGLGNFSRKRPLKKSKRHNETCPATPDAVPRACGSSK